MIGWPTLLIVSKSFSQFQGFLVKFTGVFESLYSRDVLRNAQKRWLDDAVSCWTRHKNRMRIERFEWKSVVLLVIDENFIIEFILILYWDLFRYAISSNRIYYWLWLLCSLVVVSIHQDFVLTGNGIRTVWRKNVLLRKCYEFRMNHLKRGGATTFLRVKENIFGNKVHDLLNVISFNRKIYRKCSKNFNSYTISMTNFNFSFK